jgi:DNA polymerase-1
MEAKLSQLGTVQAGEEFYTVHWWTPGEEVFSNCRTLGVDSETEPIIKGAPKKPVLAQICDHDNRRIQVVHYTLWDYYFIELYEKNPTAIWVMHNAAFDVFAIGDPREEEYAWLMDLMENNRIVDTGVRFVLRDLKRGTFQGRWGLDYVAEKLLKIKIDKGVEKGKKMTKEERAEQKAKSLRMTFRQFNEDGSVWQPTWEHIEYAVIDAAITSQLLEKMPNPYPTESICFRGNIALEDISNRGMLVDEEERQRMFDKYTKRIEQLTSDLRVFGWNPGSGRQNQQRTQDIMEFIEESEGIVLPRTKGSKGKPAYTDENGYLHPEVPAKPGQIQMTDDALEKLTVDHSFIETYKAYGHENKIRTTYLSANGRGVNGEELYDRIGVDGRVHPRFKGMVKTGRTSCGEPNLQNVPRAEGVRGIYIPTPGYIFFACDYSQAELCALAENNHQKYGHIVPCKMLDIINEGTDLHVWLGREIFLREGHTDEQWEELGKKQKKDYRQLSKALNFGAPGGLGAPTFVTYAKGWGCKITEDRAADLIDFWKNEAFPEMSHHLSPPPDGKQKGTNDYGEEEYYSVYLGETITGRIRSKASYCSACNYSFQGLAADGAKIAMWELWKHGYRMVNFIHDEVVFELREDDPLLHEKIQHIKDVMLYGMRQVLPNVTGLKCDGALMRRWHKEAEQELDPITGHTLIYDDIVACAPVGCDPEEEYDLGLDYMLKAKHGENYKELILEEELVTA